ncbi:bifunctional sugar-1-phosphate nucleotidylyltransferase/acetyltransferase [Halanaeroarchaeum sulfurireducens]|uniref:Bifunctional protein GlmU n=1 Tax=Halanaeroarchaeum sulfurireducens TaxID=1604004 RepID=A0A0N9N9R8_9EURY|nr:bifunctional sugar-1-phosphate nucleotidylyltransferase/acetyltransferase [Halanaeroarchaeum sulfurireducens]ALG81782.1 glucose-1-phosphate thymidylyltransferase [Halanaeroarchaeum sulfurireducens]
MKAVILAAGAGERLEPVTSVRPKPMAPVANKPLLAHVVEATVDAGFEEIVLVVGYKRERIQNFFGDGDDWGTSIEYAFQDPRLGTGDAVLQARDAIEDDFVVMNGDRIFESELLQEVRDLRNRTGETLMAVTYVDEPELYGVVETDADNRVREITEKPPAHAIDTDLINAGVYSFGPDIFQAIEETSSPGELALTDVLNRYGESHPVRAVTYDGTWLDVSRPWDLLPVNEALLGEDESPSAETAEVHPEAVVHDRTALGDDVRIHANATIQQGVSIGDNVHVGPNVTIQNAIVMADTTIEAGSVIRDAIIAENVDIGPNVTIPGGKTTVCLHDTIHEDVRLGAVIGDNVSIGGAVSIASGGQIGTGSRVSMGSFVAESIGPETLVTQG